MKRMGYAVLAGLFAFLCTAAPPEAAESQPKAAASVPQNMAVLETDLGKIVIAFYSEDAPGTVKNFKKLVGEGFYNGTYFHRVIPGFMIQGGDPNTRDDNRGNDGMGGPGYTVKAEFNKNKHVRGTVSMARTQDPNSAGSQFFICVAPASHLDGQYTAFGKVVEGMDVVDKIVKAPRDRMDNPLKPIHIQKAYLK